MASNTSSSIRWSFHRPFKRARDRIPRLSKSCFVSSKESEVRKCLILPPNVREPVDTLSEKTTFITSVRNSARWNTNFLSSSDCWYHSKIPALWKKFNIVFVRSSLDFENILNISKTLLFLETTSCLTRSKVKNGRFLATSEFCRPW